MEEGILDIERQEIKYVAVYDPQDDPFAYLTVQLFDGTFRSVRADSVDGLRHKVSQVIWDFWYFSGGNPRTPMMVPNFITEMFTPASEIIVNLTPAGA